MRLWAEQLLTSLPRPQLLGQHRECCALRGLGWARPHQTVNYVFCYPPSFLFAYHKRVMDEMGTRGYKVNQAWFDPLYRGQRCAPWSESQLGDVVSASARFPVYPEHNPAYLQECVDNLRTKGIFVTDIKSNI